MRGTRKRPEVTLQAVPSEDLEEDAPRTAEQLKEIGAATSDAASANKRAATVKARKQRGDKSVMWNQHEDILYELIMDTFGNEQLWIRIKRTSPEPHDFGRVSHTNLRTYKLLMDHIDDQCWDGSKSIFQWEIFHRGWERLGGDQIPKEDSPLQRAKFTARNRAAAQEILGASQGQPQQQQMQVAQPAVVMPVAPAPVVSPEIGTILNRLAERLDEIDEKIEGLDDDDPTEHTDPGAIAMPPSPMIPKTQEPQYEPFQLPDGSTAWRPKVTIVAPPANFPPPPTGFAYRMIDGAWQCTPIQQAPAPVAPQPLQPAAVSPGTMGMLPQEREMLERAHNLETELAVIKATQSVLEKQRRAADSEPQQHYQQAMAQAPAGHQWVQDPSGKWQLAQISPQVQAPQPAAAQTSAPSAASNISMLAKEATEIKGAMSKIATIFGGGSEGTSGLFPKAGEAASQAAQGGSEPKIPLEPLDVGSDIKLWWNHDTKKFVDGPMQAVMNLPAAMEGLKGLAKEVVGGIREMREDERKRDDQKTEKNKREAQDMMRAQYARIQQLEDMVRRSRQDRQPNQEQDQVIALNEPEPEQAPSVPQAPAVSPPVRQTESITSIVRSVLTKP